MMMKEMNAAAVAACGWRTRMTTEGGRRRYLPARDQIMISRARREAAAVTERDRAIVKLHICLLTLFVSARGREGNGPNNRRNFSPYLNFARDSRGKNDYQLCVARILIAVAERRRERDDARTIDGKRRARSLGIHVAI